jgi:hypothetical protein
MKQKVEEAQGTQTLCEIETPATEPIPRKFQRLRMKRKNYLLLSYFVIICVCFYGNVSSSFHKVNLIVWRKSDKPAVTGLKRVLFQSPCFVFLDQSFISIKNQEL